MRDLTTTMMNGNSNRPNWMLTEEEIDAIEKVIESREEEERVKCNARLDYIDLLDDQQPQGTSTKNPHRYVKMYKTTNKTILLPRLTTPDKAFLFSVLPYLNRGTNILTDNKGRPLTQKDLLGIVECSRTSLNRLMIRLMEVEVISKVIVNKQEVFKVNSKFFEG